MGFEGYAENERKKKEAASEAEQKREIAERLAFNREKERISGERDRLRQLETLKSLVERGLVRPETAKLAAAEEAAEDLPGVMEIVRQIEEIESIEKIDEILPKDLRLTRDEYLSAVRREADRKAALAKVDSALSRLHQLSWGGAFSSIQVIFGFLNAAGQNLTKVQEHQIDLKRDLKARGSDKKAA